MRQGNAKRQERRETTNWKSAGGWGRPTGPTPHLSAVAFSRRLYVAERKANPSSASYSPVCFYTFLFLLQSYLCTSNHPCPQNSHLSMCKNSSLSIWALASISPSGSTAASELLYLCLRCICHPRVSYSFFCLFTSFDYSFEEFVPVSESIVWKWKELLISKN